jgi:hypothetical protein
MRGGFCNGGDTLDNSTVAHVVTIKPRRWRGEALKEVFPSSQKKQTPRAGLITRLDSAEFGLYTGKCQSD